MTTVTLHLPSQMAAFAEGKRQVGVAAATARAAFAVMDDIAPMLRSQIFDARGNVRQFIGLFINDEQVHDLQELDSPLQAGSTILVVQSVAGG